MRVTTAKQLMYESDTLKRMLGLLSDENIYLKNKVTEILRTYFDQSLLEEIELFNNRFVREDILISLLRSDIAEMDDLLLKETFENVKAPGEIERNFRLIRNNVLNAEMQFEILKKDFAIYISEIYNPKWK